MTHPDVSLSEKNKPGITEKLVRTSIGVEYYEDLIYDLGQALEKV